MTLYDVEEIPTHGGSLRIFGSHAEDDTSKVSFRVEALLRREEESGFDRVGTYFGFGEKVRATKRKLLKFLIEAKEADKTVVGYGAPGKGNTLLNYCGIGMDFLDYTVEWGAKFVVPIPEVRVID
jgi:C-methyltransferase-like protein